MNSLTIHDIGRWDHGWDAPLVPRCRTQSDGLRVQLDHRSKQPHLDLRRGLRRGGFRGDSPADHAADGDFLRLVAADLRGEVR